MRWWTRAFGGDARGPRDVDTALRSALLALLESDLDRAEEALARAVRLDANAVEVYIALGRLYRMRGEIGRAIRVDQNLLLRRDLGPSQRAVVLFDLAEDFRLGGFLRRAIASYDEVLAEDKRHVRALRALVPLLTRIREFPRALELVRRLAKLEGTDRGAAEAALLVEMARSARAEGDGDGARRAARKALRRDKKCVAAWVILGELEAERGRSKAALAAWLRVPALDLQQAAQVYPQLEASYAALGRTGEFETFLASVLDEHPGDRGARRALAQALLDRGEVDAAVAELRTLIEADADDLEARSALGRILLAGDRADETANEHGALIDALERAGLLGTREKLE